VLEKRGFQNFSNKDGRAAPKLPQTRLFWRSETTEPLNGLAYRAGRMTKLIAEQVPGYTYGTDAVAPSPITLQELEILKVTVGFTEEDQRYLLLAGEVLTGQTREIVLHWRSGIIAGIPNLARHSRSLAGKPLPDYLAKSNLRFEQWILDTCFRP
jgi:hypothetical protein